MKTFQYLLKNLIYMDMILEWKVVLESGALAFMDNICYFACS